jgi:hypothetical protein
MGNACEWSGQVSLTAYDSAVRQWGGAFLHRVCFAGTLDAV